MKIAILKKRYNLVIYVGLPGMITMLGAVALLYALSPSLSIEDAKKRVRLSLERELLNNHRAMLEKAGDGAPDMDTAKQWAKEISRINNLQFVSVQIKRPLPDIFLGVNSPTWVVRVVFLDEDEQQSIRYFWLTWGGIDREISAIAWFLSI